MYKSTVDLKVRHIVESVQTVVIAVVVVVSVVAVVAVVIVVTVVTVATVAESDRAANAKHLEVHAGLHSEAYAG